MLTSHDIRMRFLKFFKEREHAILPSASLIAESQAGSVDATLFNIAGMKPLMPYLLGEKHPKGTRLANFQKCLRTVDLDEVGDNTHNTFFEMLGNWSLGDYFKQDAIKWSYEFLTSKEEGLGLNPGRLYVTVFAGNETIPRDMESVEIWKSLGVPEHRIYYKDAASNWWSAGLNSPAGPSTEMFYDLIGNLGDMDQFDFEKAEEAQRVVEIWNDVFMVYRQENGEVVGELPTRNVDTGAGLERVTTVVQGKESIYDTDIFAPLIEIIKKESGSYNERSARIIADHMRASLFLMSDGVFPSNKDQGYVLRRLIRRAVLQGGRIGLPESIYGRSFSYFIELYKEQYPELQNEVLVDTLQKEEEKFIRTLDAGLKEFEKGVDPFVLATTYGFPVELTEELAKEKGIEIDRADFDVKMKAHQDLSRSGSEQKFKGGLANTNEKTVKLHTAHHLLLAALQEIVDKNIHQRGSNITEERLRMDFSFDRKVTPEELVQVEALVNSWIEGKFPVVRREMPREEAEKLGAEMEFGAKYPDIVSVYTIQDPADKYVSKEFCGGPHVTNTGDIGKFKIQKEEASSAGVRRIKAVIE